MITNIITRVYMIHKPSKLLYALGVLVLTVGLGAFTCAKQQSINTAYIGTWSTQNANIKVRTKTGVMSYQFTPLIIPISINITAQGQASCKLGDADLIQLNLLRNKGNSDKTGIIYTIPCGQIGKLNHVDPETKKEIELWIKPLTKANKLHIEIRQMGTLDAFPMGEVVLEKTK
jgi:hypothetical protein